jgi:hypothetical protein
MEFERIEQEDPRNMKYLKDGKPVTFEEVNFPQNEGGM